MLIRVWLLALLTVFGSLNVLAQGKDPRVPPGTDPGGMAVALISGGIDYTLPEIAGRLARDGEGEIVGWDFVDGDPLPFAPVGDQSSNGTVLAKALLAEAPKVRLVPVRVDSGQPRSLAKALAFVAKTPARVVLITALPVDDDLDLLRAATQEFKHLLIVVPAGSEIADLDNVLPATASDSAKSETQNSAFLLDLTSVANVLRIAAEATANAPSLDGAGLKRAVLERQRKRD